MTKSKKKIFTYLGILIVLSSIFYAFIISAGTLNAGGGIYVLGLMWMPGISGMATQLIFEHSLKNMGWKAGKFGYWLLAYAIPLIYCIVVYGITWISGLGKFAGISLPDGIIKMTAHLPQGVVFIIYSLLVSIIGVVMGMISGMGEEIGWRGLLFPELSKITSFNKATLITGAIWTLWHLPLILFADYINAGIPRWYGALMFALMVTGINFTFSWLRQKSGSIWPAAALHASHNYFVQGIFTPLTIQTMITPYIIDEFGIGLAVAGLFLALIFWEKKKPLPALPLVDD